MILQQGRGGGEGPNYSTQPGREQFPRSCSRMSNVSCISTTCSRKIATASSGLEQKVSSLDTSMRLNLRLLRMRMQWSVTRRFFSGVSTSVTAFEHKELVSTKHPRIPKMTLCCHASIPRLQTSLCLFAQLVEMPTSSSFSAGTPQKGKKVSVKVLRIRQGLCIVFWLFCGSASRPVESGRLPIAAFRASATGGAQAAPGSGG